MAQIGKTEVINPIATLINGYADILLKQIQDEKNKIPDWKNIFETPDEIIALNTLEIAIADKMTYRKN